MTTQSRFRSSLVFLIFSLSACSSPPSMGPDDAEESSPPPFACEAPLDPTAPTSFYEAVSCLFLGESALQTGVTEGAIDEERVAVLRGRVLDVDGNPVRNAMITVLGHSEWGQTLSRQSGEYDLVVNGGGQLTIRVEHQGYLRAQRHLTTAWRRFESFPDIVLLEPSPPAPQVDLARLEKPTLVRGPTSEDADGRRSHAVLLSSEQKVTAVLPDKSQKELDRFSLVATEFTVGPGGPQAMPADLPETSAYTYAIDLSVAEAEELGAERVEFSPPLINYVDNFLGFGAGTVVPLGFYNEERDVWEASESGVVLKILAIVDGLAQIDLDGDDAAESASTLEGAGILEDELRLLASEYQAGDSLWRVEVTHFSTWDLNWPFGFPLDAINAVASALGFGPEDCRRSVRGSIIGCEDQTLGEVLPITGTPYSLHYQSERVPGRRDRYALDIALSGEVIPPSLKRIELEVEVLGRVFKSEHPPVANSRTTFKWDGKDPYDRTWQGAQPATVRVGYVYDGAYEETERFGQVGRGSPITGDSSREEITSWATWEGSVGGFNHTGLGLGAWSIDVHHVLDRRGGKLHLGTGRTRSAETMGPTVSTIAGTGKPGFSGDDGLAKDAELSQIHGMVVAADGTVYFSDEANHRIRRIHPNGIIDTYAGNGEDGSLGDGSQARDAQLGAPLGLALGADGTLYVCQRNEAVVRAISPLGVISTFAGGGESRAQLADGLMATEAQLNEPHALAFAPDGSLYVADSDDQLVRRIDPSGRISTVVGTGDRGSSGDGGPATEAKLDTPLGLAVDQAGALYITEFYGHRIRRVDQVGIITTFAGTGTAGFSGDGGAANLAEVDSPHDVQIGGDGSVYFSDEDNQRIRRVRPDGMIETVAGNGESSSSTKPNGDGGSPLEARFSQPRVLFSHQDGSLWVGDFDDDNIRRIDAPFPSFVRGESMVASSDGTQLYVFDQEGRHQRTLNALTGFPLLRFEYDPSGVLESIIDAHGLRTTIEHSLESGAIVGPYGHTTLLDFDARDFLTTVRDPKQMSTQLGYSEGGLLTSFQQANDKELHLFEYDDDGLLLRDTSPSGYFQSFERRSLENGSSVIRTHRGGRPEIHEIFTSPAGDDLRVFTDAAGISRTTARSPSLISTETPTASRKQLKTGDPRFGMQAALTAEDVYSPAPGLEQVIGRERSVALSDPNNPLSIESLEDVVTINDSEWVKSWNASTLQTTVVSPEGRVFATQANQIGQTVRHQLGATLPHELSYDERGRLSSISRGARLVQLLYGSDGLASSVIDPMGRETSFERDALGQVTAQIFADGTQLTMVHDDLGRFSSITPPGAQAHRLTYAPGGLLEGYVAPAAANSAKVDFSYDLFEALETVNDGAGTQHFVYENSSGRLSEIQIAESTTTLSYDAQTGQLTRVRNPEVDVDFTYNGALPAGQQWSGVVEGSVALSFDEELRLKSESAAGVRVEFEYDDDGLLTEAGALALTLDPELGRIKATHLDAIGDERLYNEYGELSESTFTNSGGTLYSRKDNRDLLGRIESRSETISGVTVDTVYSYDLRGRLSEVQRDGVVVESYNYDENGNRTSATIDGEVRNASYDAQDRLVASGAVEITTSVAGDLTRKNEAGVQTDYIYDRRGGLRKVELSDGRTIEYVLDGLSRRVGKKVDGDLVQAFLYRDGLSPVAELGTDGKTLVSRFVYGTSPFVPDYMEKDGETYRFITDQVGSVRLVVNASDGSIAQQITYTAFGAIKEDTNPGFQPFSFAGGLLDQDTTFVRFGARDYDPSLGRWTSKDPILFHGGQANLYVYVGNDPVNFVDPEGQVAFLVTVGIGAGIGATVGYLNKRTLAGAMQGAGVGAATGLVAGTFGLAGVALAEAGSGAGIANTVAGVGLASEAAIGLGLETAVFGESSLGLRAYGEFNAYALGTFAEWFGRFGPKGRIIGEVVGEFGTELGAWWKQQGREEGQPCQ